MVLIRHVEIRNFRGLRQFIWCPKEGVNCLIGPGDSGKSTILDAIDITLGARRQFVFSDSDFHVSNTVEPIDIKITIGGLDKSLLNVDLYGYFLRSFEPTTASIHDEPTAGLETVLTLRLQVRDDLEPHWGLFSERAQNEDKERSLVWSHRQDISPVRLGAYSAHHMAWGAKSILNKLSADKAEAASALAVAARQARQAFADEGCAGVDDVLESVNSVAQNLGIEAQNTQALLDVQGVSFSGGAIALHDERNVPLKNLGTGSSRLLVAGLQNHVSNSSITILDEVEYGLEPYRILRLLDELGAKSTITNKQVFMTTHSSVVLRELRANQLNIVRAETRQVPAIPAPPGGVPNPPQNIIQNRIMSLAGEREDEQKLLRTNAEAFLAPNVIICEGKTEIGLIRGTDFFNTARGKRSIISHGCFWADGSGDPSLFGRAKIFSGLGYRTAILMDSDKTTPPDTLEECRASNIAIYRWPAGMSTEMVVFSSASIDCIAPLLTIACDWKSQDAVNSCIQSISGGLYNFDMCKDAFVEEMRPILAQCAITGNWFKDIEPAEKLMEQVILPNWGACDIALKQPILDLFNWIGSSPTRQPENPVQEA